MAPIYRSKYDPYDVNRRQPYHTITVGDVRVRIHKNETWKGIVWKFDVVEAIDRGDTDEISRGIPLECAYDAAECLQKLAAWVTDRRTRPATRKKPSDLDLAFMNKSNRKR